MQRYKYCFVVLTYRNTVDVVDFIQSIKSKFANDEYKIIIVNSFYDKESMQEIGRIAKKFSCDFYNIDNKGYSYGNNYGFKKAVENYKFDYLICSNPDIIIKKFEDTVLQKYPNSIYCGEIINLKEKNQNPMLIIKNSISNFLIYKGYICENKLLIFTGLGINFIIRKMFTFFNRLLSKRTYSIYQPHGSFIVFSYDFISKHTNLFDENMFLFGEEAVVAYKAKKSNVKIYYSESISCIHKEDGSMNLFDGNLNNITKESIIYYYENYEKR